MSPAHRDFLERLLALLNEGCEIDDLAADPCHNDWVGATKDLLIPHGLWFDQATNRYALDWGEDDRRNRGD